MALIRKITLGVCFISAIALGAPAISIEKNTDQGQLQNAFTQVKGKWVYVANTNYFDQDELSAGEYSIKNQDSLESSLTALERVHTALKKTKEITGKSQEKKLIHQTHYKVGKYTIDRSHPYFEKVSKIYEAMKFNSQLKLESGIRLERSSGLKLESLKDGKVKESKPFLQSFHCHSQGRQNVCDFEKSGVLFLNSP